MWFCFFFFLFCKVEVMFSANTAKRTQRTTNSHLSNSNANQEQVCEAQYKNTAGSEKKNKLQNSALELSCNSADQLLTNTLKGTCI